MGASVVCVLFPSLSLPLSPSLSLPASLLSLSPCLPLRMYFGEHNVKGMFSVLEPLHHRMERGPETLKEISFNHVRNTYFVTLMQPCIHTHVVHDHPPPPPPQAYGRDLAEANEWCKKYQATGNVKELTQAWELYYHVFRKISKQLPQVWCVLCVTVVGLYLECGSTLWVGSIWKFSQWVGSIWKFSQWVGYIWN